MQHSEAPIHPAELAQHIAELSGGDQLDTGQLKELAQQYASLHESYSSQKTQYEELKEKYEILRRAFFGRRSEKLSAEEREQGSLFNEAELEVDADEQEAPDGSEADQNIAKSRVRSAECKRKPLPESLPREDVYHDIAEDQKQCGCGTQLVRIGEEVSEQLHIKPAQIVVLRHIRPKYACKGCEGVADESTPAVRIAPKPESLLSKSIASNSVAAHIIVSKYCDAVPLYRQEKQFSRIGVQISRNSMARWVIQLAGRISPLLAEFDKHIRSGPLIGMDETTIHVHRERDKENTSTSYMWVARGGNEENPLVRYMYHARRTANIPAAYLKGYTGALQTDGYAGYGQAVRENGLLHIGCLAHLRRKFYECSVGEGASKAALVVLNMIARIYKAEKRLKSMNLSAEELTVYRIEEVLEKLTKLQTHLEKKATVISPSSSMGKAVSYALEQLPKIKRYASVSCATLDNNAVERAIRPFVTGRKNWHIAATPSGAHASAAWYSLIESAKSAGIEAHQYITYVLDHVPEVQKTGDWASLLPENTPLT